jgi:hypothetical protein
MAGNYVFAGLFKRLSAQTVPPYAKAATDGFLSISIFNCIGTTSFSLGYVHYKKGHLKAELTWNATIRDNSYLLCDFCKNSRCSEKDPGIREQIPELRVLSTFIPKAEIRYLKNFSPVAPWQLFLYDIDNVSFFSVFVICRSI